MRNLTFQEIMALGGDLIGAGRFLWQMPHRSLDEIQAWQFTKIRELVRHAYNQVPFYRKIYSAIGFAPDDLKTWDDFYRLPIITKDQVIAHYPDQMIAADADRGTLIISRSSGSSGKVMDIAYDAKATSLYILAGLRLYQMGFKYQPWHKQLYVYTSPYPLNSLLGLYPLKFVSTLMPVRQIIDAAIRFKPDLLVCYPSHLWQIVQEMTASDRQKIRLRCISVNSEMSMQKERDTLAAFFDCRVLDEYSSEELTRIASQCRHKNYHIFEDINYLETVSQTGDSGIIVGTNLHNKAMPMIRYQQNDIGTISVKPCDCGWHFRQLSQLQGRKNDHFIMPSGKILSSGFLLDATYDMVLRHRDAVKDFCLIQDTHHLIRLQIVPDKGWREEIAQAISAQLVTFFEPDVTLTIQNVEICEKTQTGKRNPIISYVGRQHGEHLSI